MAESGVDLPAVALTGATGFVGGHILRRLLGAGQRVRVLARDPARLPDADGPVEVVHGSLSDPRALKRLVAGSESVIHCAGVVRGVTHAQFRRVNALAAGEFAGIARDAGVARFLLVSSLAAREPDLSPYAGSKRAGEDAVLGAAGSMSVTIFRPPAVYGPGDREMLSLFRLMAKGIAPVFGSADAKFSLIFVEDLADAAVAWQGAGVTLPGALELDDGNPGGYGWPDVCAAVTAITGRPIWRIRLPGGLLAVPAGINSLAGLLTPYAPMLSLGKLRELRHPDWVCRAPGNRGGIPGWRPRFRLEDGLRKTPGWRD